MDDALDRSCMGCRFGWGFTDSDLNKTGFESAFGLSEYYLQIRQHKHL